MQADKTSIWGGMTHAGATGGWRSWGLTAGSAVLEVTIDPAAHGDVVGQLSRSVYLKTSAGKQMEFTLNATVTH